MEGQLARVDLVAACRRRARPARLDDREARASRRSRAYSRRPSGDLGDVLARDVAALDRVEELELERPPVLAGSKRTVHDGELTATARLPHEAGLDLDGPSRSRCLYATLGLARSRRRNLNSLLEAVDDDLEVQLAHAGDDQLAGRLVGHGAEGRVLAHHAPDDLGQLVAVLDFFGSIDIEITVSGNWPS